MLHVPQYHDQPSGGEQSMMPTPESFMKDYKAAGKLEGRVALITGGDSGIGRAVAIAYAKEGADVAIVYHSDDDDADITAERIDEEGRRYLKIKGDIGSKAFCESAIEKVMMRFGRIDILVNNAAEQHPQKNLEDITEDQLKNTFSTNIFGTIFMCQAALPHLKKGGIIINTTSVTAYKGNEVLMDYSATKGALVTFTRSLSASLMEKEIRVNAVAPGPIWTPLIASTFDAREVEKFGKDVPMSRPGQPDEVAPCYVFLACADSSYMTGQVLHPNGGIVING